MQLWRPKKCNCLVWALVMRVRHGGRIRAHGSIWGWWPHYLWEFGGHIYEYAPARHVAGLTWPPGMFRGRVQEVVSERVIRTVCVHERLVVDRVERVCQSSNQ